MSEARGCGREELPHIRGQGQLGEATLHWRPGAAPEARGGDQEEQPEERWLGGRRRA